MNEPETLPPILLDEHDTAAVAAVLMRAIRAGDQITKDQRIVEEANARLAENTAILRKASNALALFGFEKREGENIWDHVRQVLGEDEYQRAIAIGRGAEPAGLLEHMGDEDISTDKSQPELGVAAAHPPVPVRDAILRHLRAAGESGTNVGEVKRHLAEAHGITVHAKTPGMTLYRLLKSGLARRNGRTWYASDIDGDYENEAPTADTEDASETALAAQ